MTEYFLAGLSGKSLEMNLLIVDIWKKYPQYFNDDSKISAFFGGTFMVICDLLARTLTSPAEIPIGTVTALFGAPFFIYIYSKNRKKG